MKVVILCGGSGTRLWPLSRTNYPKQFVKLFNNKSLFEKTIERNKFIAATFSIIVNEKQKSPCFEQSSSEETEYLLEPIGRNTAPAIALSALNSDPDDILLILPSDHLIENQTNYERCVQSAIEFAKNDFLVTFGIQPTYAETGFGYIESNGNDVVSFKEKPNLETAKEYINSGNYLWNSGMFCFKAKTFLEELEKYSNDIFTSSVYANKKSSSNNKIRTFDLDDIKKIPADSIDYAVMEKSSKVKVIPSDLGWSDLGSFDSLANFISNDEDNQVAINSSNNLIIGNKRIVTTLDVNDLFIIDTEDALLIGKKGSSQDVKKIVDILKQKKPELLE